MITLVAGEIEAGGGFTVVREVVNDDPAASVVTKVVAEVDPAGAGITVEELVTTVEDPRASVVVKVVAETEEDGDGGRVLELVTVETTPSGRVVWNVVAETWPPRDDEMYTIAELLEPQSSAAFPEHLVVQLPAPSGAVMGPWEPQRHWFPTQDVSKRADSMKGRWSKEAALPALGIRPGQETHHSEQRKRDSRRRRMHRIPKSSLRSPSSFHRAGNRTMELHNSPVEYRHHRCY